MVAFFLGFCLFIWLCFVLQKLYSNYSFTMKLFIFMENDLLKSYMYADREKMTYWLIIVTKLPLA